MGAATQAFVDAIIEHKPDAVGMSAFLTTTMPMLKTNIEVIEKAGLRNKTKVFIGGAPVNHEFCDEVGADGYARNANALVRLTKQLIGILETKNE